MNAIDATNATMRTIKLTIQYDGTNYSGWQSQKNGISIQDAIEKAIKRVTCEELRIVGSGRTDAGVHALGQIAHFKTRSKIPLKNLKLALNIHLPDDIVITKVEEARPGFHAQYDAKFKTYRYVVVNNIHIDPFIRRYASLYSFNVDVGLMKKTARKLVGRHDFKAFRTTDKCQRDDVSSVRNIKRLEIRKSRDRISFEIEADGFVYNMVRNIVGTLLEVGRGKMKPSQVGDLLKKKDRRLCGPKAPAKGLSLVEVKYR